MNRHTSPQLDAHRRRTARRPRPEGRGAAAEAPVRRQGRDAAAWRPAHRLDHGHRRRHAGDRSGIRLLRPDGLRCRHAARQFLDELFLAARPRDRMATATRCAHYLLGVDGRDLVGVPRRVLASLAHRAHRHSLCSAACSRIAAMRSASEQALDRVLARDLDGHAGLCRRRDAPPHPRPRAQCRFRDHRRSRTCAPPASAKALQLRPPSRGQPPPHPRHRRGQRAGRG